MHKVRRAYIAIDVDKREEVGYNKTVRDLKNKGGRLRYDIISR